jgi:hypothetical protein
MLNNLFNLGQWARKGGGIGLILAVAMLAASSVVAETLIVREGTVINSRYSTDMDATDSVEIDGGTFQNGIGGFDERNIANITVIRGIGRNERGSTVTGLVKVQGGEFANDGKITEGTVSGGTFMNNAGGSVTTLVQNNGKVNNGGWIADFVYGGGTYEAFGNGSIGNLSLDAERQFNVNSLAGIVDTFGVSSIDLAGANLVWNLSGSLADNLGFFGWRDIFGIEGVTGKDVLISVLWDDGTTDSFVYGETRDWGSYVVAFGADGITISDVPEPATLTIIGLGLAGPGLTRRRKAT